MITFHVKAEAVSLKISVINDLDTLEQCCSAPSKIMITTHTSKRNGKRKTKQVEGQQVVVCFQGGRFHPGDYNPMRNWPPRIEEVLS
ncbi:hypothetical protein AVEN_67441-1 [Araneus ventricosus]|uniref:Uncharacterized protein n=1 Tax=Araneus ventricosus TaxID=182803 RepID=A0A4Y2JRC5_ARAVE|nr:hypothetical protein AVEN_67441-1 [Araneus ventricosus]